MCTAIAKNGLTLFHKCVEICFELVVGVHGVFQKVLRRKSFVVVFLSYPASDIILGLCTIIFALIFCTVVFTILIILWIFRSFIEIYLKYKHGRDFVEMLDGTDAIWAIEDQSRGLVNGLMIIETQLDGEEFYVQMKERVCNTLLKYNKFRYCRRRLLGYLYFVTNQLQDNDIVKRMDSIDNVDELDQVQLRNLLTKYCNAPLPNNDTGTSEILIGTQTIKWRNTGTNCFQYPVLYRLHHCIADGIAMQNLITKRLADKDMGSVIDNMIKDSKKRKTVTFSDSTQSIDLKLISFLMKLGNQLRKFLTLSVHRLSYLELPENNIIHQNGKKLSGNKHFVWSVEDKPACLGMVKQLRKHFGGVGFSDIMLAAIAESFSDYFKKKSLPDEIPKTISAALTVLPPNEPIDVKSTEIILKNRFSLALAFLPLNKDGDILNTLEIMKAELKSLRQAVDVVFNYWQIKYAFGLWPISSVRYFIQKADSTMAISNLPGTPMLTILNGSKILDFIFWIPNKESIGLGLSIYTYDDRFQLGLLVDESAIEKYEDVQEILDNVFVKIGELYDRIKR